MGAIVLLQHFAASTCASHNFFGLPTWYKYLEDAGRMAPKGKVCQLVGPFQMSDVLLVALGLLDIGLRLAGILAVAYIIYGGIQYVISQGEPDKTKKAQETIINALIGVVLAMLATVIVQFIGNEIGK